MVSRSSVVKIDASIVQGEGAYVLWRRMTWGERKAYTETAKTDKLDPLALLIEHLAGWNWQTVNGEPIALPKSDADFETMYEEEILFLVSVATKALQGRLEFTVEAEKN